jgi:hypothetical protein
VKSPLGSGDFILGKDNNEMKLRKRYPFDQPDETDCKYIRLLAASADERTWWVKGGAQCGVRLLAHFAGDGYVYTARQLHAGVLAQSQNEDAARRLLTAAANEYARAGATILKIEEPSVLPGFTFHDVAHLWIHESTWHTKTERVLRLTPPWWAPDAQAFDIREGVYLYFPDGTSRLARRRDYYRFEGQRFRRVLARQGDLLFLSHFFNHIFEGWGDPYLPRMMRSRAVGDTEVIDLGRHHIDVAQGVVTHPQHGTMALPSETWLAVLEPGTSRPFADARDTD